MADRVDAATRSRMMRAIRCRDTQPEVLFACALAAGGVPFATHDQWRAREGRALPGRPDFVLADVRLAVFVHGCFWHLCPRHYRPVDPARLDWAAKMDRNRRRDVRVRRQLRRMGWRTMVVWEHEDMATAAARVRRRVALEAVCT